MTEAEAHLYLPHNEEDELDDVFEHKLFEQKQFFLQRGPIPTLISGRLNKMMKVQEAFIYFGGELKEFSLKHVEFLPYDSEIIRESFNTHAQNENRVKILINASRSTEEVRYFLKQWVELIRTYARKWQFSDRKVSDSIKLSSTQDTMQLLEEIRRFEQLGYSSFGDLQHLLTDNPLVAEANRLSLWLKLENDV